MGPLRLLILIWLVPFASGQNTDRNLPKTEAQQDGFSGPIRAVRMLSDWNRTASRIASGSLTLVPPIMCRTCAYDREGNRTQFGQFVPNGGNEKFVGSEAAIVRDPSGRMVERTVTDAATGKLLSHDWFGPFGPTKSLLYIDGKPSGSSTRTYDSAGHMTELVSRDADGRIVDRMTTMFNDQGQWIDRAVTGKEGELRWAETYDSGSDTQHYRQFDSSNAVTTEFVVAHNQMLSYWSTTDVPGRNAGMSTEYFPGQDVYQFRCHKDGQCETFRIHYEYLDGDYHLPTAVERHDASGALTDAVYVEYSADEHHNWTTRKVWLVSPQLPQRTLYEVDARSITYWPR